MKQIKGGVCAPKGFKANGIYCGIRKNKSKKDLALIYSEKPAQAACLYTNNIVKGAPLVVSKQNISDGVAQAIVCNSGNANTCNHNGLETASSMCNLVAKELSIAPTDVIVASTGVIGQPLDIEPISNGMKNLVSGLGDNSLDASEAIMTTDTIAKEVAFEFVCGNKTCRIGGIAKGSGMIHPDMATMLVFLTTDVSISLECLKSALSNDVESSFNMLSIDGDTSTNDMVAVLANGMAQNKTISTFDDDYAVFCSALSAVTNYLCKLSAKDGEGATKLLQCTVINAPSQTDANLVAKSVISSALVKTAMFGADANWGRVLCAIGYSKANIDVSRVDVAFSSYGKLVKVCQNGFGLDFDEDVAKQILSNDEIEIVVDLNCGSYSAVSWGCDLTYDYVKINGSYRT